MVDENQDIEEWVRSKLGEYSEDELKDVLEDEGFDPSIVDEALDNSEDSGRIVQSPGILEEIEEAGRNVYLEAYKNRMFLFSGLSLIGLGILVFGFVQTGFELPQSRDGSECPDVGIRIMDIYSNNGSTTVDTRIYRGSHDLVVEIYRDGALLESSTKMVKNTENFTFNTVGDKAVLHPKSCEIYRDSLSYTG